MPELRIILLVLGAILVLGIYLADRYRRRRAGRSEYGDDNAMDEGFSAADPQGIGDEPLPGEWVGKAFTAQREAVVDEAHLEGLKGLNRGETIAAPAAEQSPLYATRTSAEVAEEPLPPGEGRGAERADSGPSVQEQVVVLTLMAPAGTLLRGTRLLKALQDNGLRHGEMEIFHFTPEGIGQPLFSVANILEPGRFVLSEMAQMETPGIALFMQLPASIPNSEALRLLLQKARQIAASLGATLCDGQRQPLDEKGLTALEKRVVGDG